MRVIDGKAVVLINEKVTCMQLAKFGALLGCTFKRHESGAIEMVSKEQAVQASKQDFRPLGG